MDFSDAYKLGRRKLRLYPFSRKKNYLLSLAELLLLVRPFGESFVGIKDIPVERILGSENRSQDFATGFLPVRRWMETRWNRVRDLLLGPGISEPLKVLEYGGYYFVRDGNHRVSVARTNGIEFLTAEVTELKIPVKLPPHMDRSQLPVFAGKFRLHRDTGIFDVIPEEHFMVACPSTWDEIEESIFRGHLEWFRQKNGYVPDRETLIQSWNVELYETTMEHIKKHHLSFLSPGRRETDVFCDLMKLWSIQPEAWLPDVYGLYIRKMQRRNLLRSIVRHLRRLRQWLSTTALEERSLFLQVSRLFFFRPNADFPTGSKYYYRFLRKQLTSSHYRYLRRKLGRNPYMQELTTSWYDELFAPAFKLHRKHAIGEPFSLFYMKWMGTWQRQILRDQGTTLEDAFRMHLKKRGLISHVRDRVQKNNE